MYIMTQTNNSTDTDQKNNWGKYFSALVGFILSWIMWLLIGSMALWAFQNKSTESVLPTDIDKLPYMNLGGASIGKNGVDDFPLFSYKSPVGLPYSLREKIVLFSTDLVIG